MALGAYRKKRLFTKTPEPRGAAGRSAPAGPRRKLRFVVQKHAATRLHYDFRLELGGVLVSWAVPKGPSLDPADKRLAMKVEDHPFDYRTFEGTIPDGQYGAGTVMVWDEGWYEPYEDYTTTDREKVLRHGLHKGDLKIVLHGKKLTGAWAVVRAKSFGESSWLMIKKRDDGASRRDVTLQDRSVRTDRTMDEIAGKRRVAIDLSAAPKGRFPKDPRPMLATLTPKPFDRDGWLFEIKWDGYRAISSVKDGTVVIRSRHGQDYTERYAPIVDELATLAHDAVLDGEVVAVDRSGRSRFQLLQRYHATGKGNLRYFVFDILYLDGHNLTGLPLRERKRILSELLAGGTRVAVSDHVETDGERFFAAARRRKLEGIMAKDGDSPYRPGVRTRSWLKVKAGNRQEVVIAGFTEPRGTRKRFGSLVLGVYGNGSGQGGRGSGRGKGDVRATLRYVGHVGTGFDAKLLDEVYQKLKPLMRKTCPFASTPPPGPSRAPATWVTPELVGEVAFTEWTDEGHLRHPAFVGLREDKPARDVVRERPHG